MPTLEQLAPSGRTQQASITTASGAGVAPTVETPASKLAGDLLGIVGQTSRTTQQVNTLSVGAAKRVAIQNLTDMAKDLEAIKANAEPDIDPRELQAANMAVYQHYGKIKFDNADAQEAFDSMYHLSGSKAIARQNSILEQQANLNDHKALTSSIEDSLASQLQIGIEQSKDMIDSYVEGITSGGYENKDQAYKRLSDILNINLNKHHEVNRNLQIYIDGKVDPKLQTQEFNKFYGSMAKIDDEGNVTKVGDTSDEAVQSIINNWKALKNRDAERSSEYNLRFHQAMADGNHTKSNNATVYVPSTEIERNIKSLSDEFMDININQPLKESEAGQATILIQQLQNQLEETQYVEQDVLSGNVNNLRTYLKDGREVKNFVSQLTGREKSFTITASKYKSAINHVLETQSNALMNMQVTPENQDEFIRRLSTVDRMEQLSEKKSAFTNKYETVFAPGVSPTPMGRNELQQAIAFHRYKQRVNPAYQAEAGVVAQLEALYTKTIDGKPLDEKQIATQSESILTVEKNTNAAAVNSKEMVKIVDDKLQDLADGTGQWFTMLNATIPSGTGNALKQYIISNGKNIVAEDFMNNLPTVDYGSFVPTVVGATPDQRIVVPIGVEKETFKKAINATINGYNKKHNTNFGPSSYNDSVVFRTVYDKGMDNFITEIYNRDDVNERIGVLHINNIDVTATK